MSRLAWLAGKLSEKRIARETTRHLDSLAREPIRASERSAREMLQKLRSEPGPHAHLGETEWGEDVMVPLSELVKACGIVTGGTGAGKSMAACAVIEALTQHLPQSHSVSYGILDAKGERFERALFFLDARLQELDDKAREELLNRIVIIDFSSQKAVSP